MQLLSFDHFVYLSTSAFFFITYNSVLCKCFITLLSYTALKFAPVFLYLSLIIKLY